MKCAKSCLSVDICENAYWTIQLVGNEVRYIYRAILMCLEIGWVVLAFVNGQFFRLTPELNALPLRCWGRKAISTEIVRKRGREFVQWVESALIFFLYCRRSAAFGTWLVWFFVRFLKYSSSVAYVGISLVVNRAFWFCSSWKEKRKRNEASFDTGDFGLCSNFAWNVLRWGFLQEIKRYIMSLIFHVFV